MNLIDVSRQPIVTVPETATVLEAVEAMVARRVGAVMVVKEGRLQGIFTERDLMKTVVAKELPPRTTPVSGVMTQRALTLDPATTANDALRIMLERQFRHIPLVDREGKVVGMLSLRDLLRHKVEDLDRELDAVVERFTNDAPGG